MGTLGDIPLVVLSAGHPPVSAGWGISADDAERFNAQTAKLQDELAALSPRCKREVVDQCGHYIQVARPDLVIVPSRRWSRPRGPSHRWLER